MAGDETGGGAPRGAKVAAALVAVTFFALILATIVYALVAG